MPLLYLASRSPRRRELLAQIGVVPQLVDVEVDETPLPGEAPPAYVERLARAKAAAGAAQLADAGVLAADAVVMGADTTVVIDGCILGKPADASEAGAMLARLAGRTHQVFTGVAVASSGRVSARLSCTDVTFAELDSATIARYCATGEPLDKAGAYGIQGRAAAFVRRIDGSYSGVVGLPLYDTAQLLRAAGIEC